MHTIRHLLFTYQKIISYAIFWIYDTMATKRQNVLPLPKKKTLKKKQILLLTQKQTLHMNSLKYVWGLYSFLVLCQTQRWILFSMFSDPWNIGHGPMCIIAFNSSSLNGSMEQVWWLCSFWSLSNWSQRNWWFLFYVQWYVNSWSYALLRQIFPKCIYTASFETPFL